MLRLKAPLEAAGSTIPAPPIMAVPLGPVPTGPTARPRLLALGGLFTVKQLEMFKDVLTYKSRSRFRTLYALLFQLRGHQY